MNNQEDEDIAKFIAAQKRARQQGAIKALRVIGAGVIAAAACLMFVYGLGMLDQSSNEALADAGLMRSARGEMRRGLGTIALIGFGCFAIGSLVFIGAYRLFGGKVDRDTMAVVLNLIGLGRR